MLPLGLICGKYEIRQTDNAADIIRDIVRLVDI